MEKLNIKEEARKLIDKLPDNSTWDDLTDFAEFPTAL
jgi:hypothetical protein